MTTGAGSQLSWLGGRAGEVDESGGDRRDAGGLVDVDRKLIVVRRWRWRNGELGRDLGTWTWDLRVTLDSSRYGRSRTVMAPAASKIPEWNPTREQFNVDMRGHGARMLDREHEVATTSRTLTNSSNQLREIVYVGTVVEWVCAKNNVLFRFGNCEILEIRLLIPNGIVRRHTTRLVRQIGREVDGADARGACKPQHADTGVSLQRFRTLVSMYFKDFALLLLFHRFQMGYEVPRSFLEARIDIVPYRLRESDIKHPVAAHMHSESLRDIQVREADHLIIPPFLGRLVGDSRDLGTSPSRLGFPSSPQGILIVISASGTPVQLRYMCGTASPSALGPSAYTTYLSSMDEPRNPCSSFATAPSGNVTTQGLD
ncbi:hypothetical protein CHU98_g11562 [Xylaria longipes]|nr:hypothetical protein CHU98_g11562 [Xylaria longipes]